MLASIFFLASFVIKQLTPKCVREVRDISKDVVFALEEARLCQDFVKQNPAIGVNAKPRNSLSRQNLTPLPPAPTDLIHPSIVGPFDSSYLDS